MATYKRCDALFEIAGVPIAQVTLWSTKLRAWVYLVPKKTGNVPPGTYEITPEDVQRMEALIADGWPLETVIYRVTGQRVGVV